MRKVWPNALGVVVIVFFAFPAYWMIRTAFLPTIDIQSDPPVFVPTDGTFDHFVTAVTRPGFWNYVRNSLFVTLSAVALSTITALLAAVAVARFRFRGARPTWC